MRMRMLAALAAAPLVLGSVAGPAVAEVNEVTPSTNDENAANGWAHFTASRDFDAVELTFTTTRNLVSCFEYRADDEAPQEGMDNYNEDVVDGLWEFVCVNATGTQEGIDTETIRVEAEQFVDVRLVFGGERDERFDWTRVTVRAVEPPTTAQECKKGGFADFGYANQGRCVSAVKRAERDARKADKAQHRAAVKAAKAANKAGKGKK